MFAKRRLARPKPSQTHGVSEVQAPQPTFSVPTNCIKVCRPLAPKRTTSFRWTTLGYAEKVRPQFLSLRQRHSSPDCSGKQKADMPQQSGSFQELACTSDCRITAFPARNGIFFRSFVPRHFSIVQKSEGREQQLAARVSRSLNLSRTSENNEARTTVRKSTFAVISRPTRLKATTASSNAA
jgi:hypothetical protein